MSGPWRESLESPRRTGLGCECAGGRRRTPEPGPPPLCPKAQSVVCRLLHAGLLCAPRFSVCVLVPEQTARPQGLGAVLGTSEGSWRPGAAPRPQVWAGGDMRPGSRPQPAPEPRMLHSTDEEVGCRAPPALRTGSRRVPPGGDWPLPPVGPLQLPRPGLARKRHLPSPRPPVLGVPPAARPSSPLPRPTAQHPSTSLSCSLPRSCQQPRPAPLSSRSPSQAGLLPPPQPQQTGAQVLATPLPGARQGGHSEHRCGRRPCPGHGPEQHAPLGHLGHRLL